MRTRGRPASNARRTLELAVHWLYKHDPALKLPYQEHLSALIHEPTFRDAVGPAVFAKGAGAQELGNLAVQQPQAGAAIGGHHGTRECSIIVSGSRAPMPAGKAGGRVDVQSRPAAKTAPVPPADAGHCKNGWRRNCASGDEMLAGPARGQNQRWTRNWQAARAEVPRRRRRTPSA